MLKKPANKLFFVGSQHPMLKPFMHLDHRRHWLSSHICIHIADWTLNHEVMMRNPETMMRNHQGTPACGFRLVLAGSCALNRSSEEVARPLLVTMLGEQRPGWSRLKMRDVGNNDWDQVTNILSDCWFYGVVIRIVFFKRISEPTIVGINCWDMLGYVN